MNLDYTIPKLVFYIQFLEKDRLWKSVIGCTGSRLCWVATVLSLGEQWVVMHRVLKGSKSMLPCHILNENLPRNDCVAMPLSAVCWQLLSELPSYSKNNWGIPSAVSVSSGSMPWWSIFYNPSADTRIYSNEVWAPFISIAPWQFQLLQSVSQCWAQLQLHLSSISTATEHSCAFSTTCIAILSSQVHNGSNAPQQSLLHTAFSCISLRVTVAIVLESMQAGNGGRTKCCWSSRMLKGICVLCLILLQIQIQMLKVPVSAL